MPRLPVDGKKVIEHRISLSGVERRALQSLATSERLKAIDLQGKLEILEDPEKVIAIMYSIATIIEIFGIETNFPLPTITDVQQYLNELKQKREFAENFTNIPGAAVTGSFAEYKGNPLRLIFDILGVDLNEAGL
jgi:hypothetical protein